MVENFGNLLLRLLLLPDVQNFLLGLELAFNLLLELDLLLGQ